MAAALVEDLATWLGVCGLVLAGATAVWTVHERRAWRAEQRATTEDWHDRPQDDHTPPRSPDA